MCSQPKVKLLTFIHRALARLYAVRLTLLLIDDLTHTLRPQHRDGTQLPRRGVRRLREGIFSRENTTRRERGKAYCASQLMTSDKTTQYNRNWDFPQEGEKRQNVLKQFHTVEDRERILRTGCVRRSWGWRSLRDTTGLGWIGYVCE